MYLFYLPTLSTLYPATPNGEFSLSEDESAHCVRVLRYEKNDQILLTDGMGTTYTACITNPHPKHCQFRVIVAEQQPKSHNFHLHIAIAPTKNVERLEWMVEKCTEIGVDEITPLLCRFSERKQLRIDRLEKIILSAAKQSLTPYLPVIHELTSFSTFMAQSTASSQVKCIAHCYKEDKRNFKDCIVPGQDVVVLIGPEGDFSEEEIQLSFQHGFIPVSLGNTRLRTETAGVVACHTAILMNS